ncbi:MAG: 2-C-methyl-D-erythritol 4-phosphate cytidylyltransferase [Bacteroidota bacterium]
MPEVVVVIPAGGRGTRLKRLLPKQFAPLGNATMLDHAVAAFQALWEVDSIVVVVPSRFVRRTRAHLTRAGFDKVVAVVKGGRTRQDSVRNGLAACGTSTGIVLVHDAARPFVSRRLIRDVIRSAVRHGAAAAALPVKETIAMERPRRRGFLLDTPSRETLWTMQTPQGFRTEMLRRAQRRAQRAGFAGTDEASLVERLGIPVRIVPGDEWNIKITTPADMKLAQWLLKRLKR